MGDRYFLDSSIPLYRYDSSEVRKQRVARQLLEEEPPGTLVVSTQVLQEFYAVATRKFANPLSHDDAATAVDRLRMLPTVAVDSAMVADAIRLCHQAQVSIWDALIIRAAASDNCTVLLTEDLNAGQAIAGVRIENPFRGLPDHP